MKTRAFLPLLLIVAAVLAAGGWQWTQYRRVDGRTGRQWLALVEQAAQTVPYRAEGHTITDGKQARFTVDQGTGGRYRMRLVDAKGRCCSLGNDGARTWYTAENTAESMATDDRLAAATPRGRITGTAMIAGRSAVLLAVHSGPLRKLIAVDRRTGIVLSMRTLFRDKPVSEMQLDKIDYREDIPAVKAPSTATVLQAATSQELAKLLGQPVLYPGRLPQRFTLKGTYVDRCSGCQMDKAVLRYTDGLSTLTLFEMRNGMMCAMGNGCQMAPGDNALVETRTFGNLTVAAVGTLSAKELDRILDSLK